MRIAIKQTMVGIVIVAIVMVLIAWIRAAKPIDPASIYSSEYVQNRMKSELVRLEKLRITAEQEEARTLAAKEVLKQAKIQSTVNLIPWKVSFWKWGSLSVLAVSCTGFLILVGCIGFAKIIEKSVHTARVNGAEIPIHHKDLSRIAPAITMISQAEMVAAVSRQESFKMVCEANRILKGIHSPALRSGDLQALPGMTEEGSFDVPPFREVLSNLRRGGEFTIGFTADKTPVNGTFDNIYSCGIFGLSRSGKTTGLYSIISQSLLVFPGIRYAVIDPHHKRNESLTAGLPKTNHFTHIDPNDFKEGVYAFISIMNDRLETERSYREEPLVLLIDELPVLLSKHGGHVIETALGRISKEGAKVDTFCLIAGQDTRISGAGGDKDLLCSRIAYNMSKKQASYLFEDKATVELHEAVRHAKRKGLCVFSSADDVPVIIQQPHCLKSDIEYVEQIMRQANGKDIIAQNPFEDHPGDTLNNYLVQHKGIGKEPVNMRKHAEKSLHELIDEWLDDPEHTQEELANNAGISGKDLSQWRNRKSMGEDRKNRIEAALKHAFYDVPEKPENSENTGKHAERDNIINLSERKNT